jgi:hypothetical protein
MKKGRRKYRFFLINFREEKYLDGKIFHSYLQKYINGGCLDASDKISYLFSPAYVFGKNASVVKKNFKQLTEGAKTSSLVRVKVEVYRGANKHVQELISFLDKNVKNDLAGAYVHGSIGIGEETGYSDFDALVILKDEVLADKDKLTDVAFHLNEARRFMFQMDPLQHHGWFVLTESDLKDFPETYFPAVLFQHAKSLFKDQGLELNLCIDAEKQNYTIPFKKLGHAIEKKIKNQRPANMYQLKNLLSEFMLLPALYVEARDQKGIFKKFSFESAQKDFSSEEWRIMNEVSLIRQQWKIKITGWKKNRIESPRFFPFNLSAMLAPKIPAEINRMLDNKFYESMLEFTNMLSKKIK